MTIPVSLRQNIDNLGRYLKRAHFVMTANRFGETPVLRARFNDAVFVSRRHRYLFASNEKVANSTLRTTFQTLEGGGRLAVGYKPFKRWTGPLLQPSDMDDFDEALSDANLFRFCVVRHPYARLISCYRNKLEEGSRGRGFGRMMRQLGLDPERSDVTFANFVTAIAAQDQRTMNPHWRIQYYNVFMDIIEYDEVIAYDDIGARLPGLVRELYPQARAAAIISANRHVRNSGDLVAQYFTADLKALVRQIYRLDFETFGFSG